MTAPPRPGVADALEDGAAQPSETGFDTRLYARFPAQGERPPGELDQLKALVQRMAAELGMTPG